MHSNLLPPFLPALALFSLAPAQAPDVVRAERAPVVLGPSPAVASHDTNANRWADGLAGLADQVLFDAPGDGRIWALAATYKASFGAEGFTYVPFFGSQAPRNYPVRFVVRGVRVGGVALQLAKDAKVVRDGARVSLLRGPVREVYDLAPRSVEQTFVVDGDLPGDVEVEVEVVTDLVEDRARDGLQFGNELGFVEYGSACLVRGTERTAIASVFVDGVLRLVVPAAQRGPGAVIIDPIITTSSLTRTTVASELPDVAYDATTDRWAVVWANVFSQTDHDIVAELRTGRGESIAGSYRSIDATTTSHSWPRIANLNAADRFLITMERHDSQGSGAQYSVWSRTLEAASPFPVGPMVQISPNASVDQKSADVGGDPGTGTNWAVVWLHGTDVHARLVDASGTPSSPVIPIERTSAVCINPQISLSNGNGQVAQPHWCIVYMNQASGSNWDVYGATLAPDGTVTRPHGPIAVAASNDLYTYVSSPLVDGRTKPVFLVSYERQEASGPEMIAVGIDSDLQVVLPETNLTRRFGFSGIYCRVESDGSRFAAVSQISNSMCVGTLAPIGSELVLHEAPTSFGTGAAPAIASTRSGGGPSVDYGVCYTQHTSNPPRTTLGIYQGRAPAGGFYRRGMGCGISIDTGGRPSIGHTVRVVVYPNPGDVPFLILGTPAPATTVCAWCSTGIDLARPTVVLPSPMELPVPPEPRLVGLTLSVQGFSIGTGDCFGAILFSDTIDVTIQ